MPDIFSEFTWNILYIMYGYIYYIIERSIRMVSKERSVLLITEFCSWMILQHLLPAIQVINLTEIKFRISSRWDFRFVLPYQGSEVGLELDGGSIQVINLSEIISLEGGDDVCELGSILIFMINII